jgi:hypothetical protein
VEFGIRTYGKVGLRIKTIVNALVRASTEAKTLLAYGRAPAIRQNCIVPGQNRVERISWIRLHSLHRCWSIHTPKKYHASGLAFKHPALQSLVVAAKPTVLDHYIRRGGERQHSIQIAAGLIYDRFHPGKIALIPMRLPAVGIGLGENNMVPALCEVFVAATIVSGRPVSGKKKLCWNQTQKSSSK